MVKLEESLFIHELAADERFFLGRGDLAVVDSGTRARVKMSGATLEAPYSATFPVTVDIEKHAYIEIRARDNSELVTVIELLSPSNKKLGADRETYIAKRRQLSASGVHLVEFD